MIRPQPKPEPRQKERKPLRAKRWGIRQRRPRRLDTAQSNPAFLAWVHGEPCCLAGPRCEGRIEAHRGPFAGMSREALRTLQDEWIAATFGRWLSHGSRRAA